MDDTRYEPVSYFIGHVDGVTHIDSKMDGRYLISNSKDQSIKLWDMRSCGRLSQERIAIRTRQTSRGKLSWDYRWDEVPSECECPVAWRMVRHDTHKLCAPHVQSIRRQCRCRRGATTAS